MDVERTSNGRRMDVEWMSNGCRMDVARMSNGCRMDGEWTSKMSNGHPKCRMNVEWMSNGCRTNVEWMSNGCRTNVEWMSNRCRTKIVVTSGIPLSHLPAPILVLKCSYKAVWPIRRLNYVFASTVGVGLKATASGFAKTRVVCILEQLWRMCFFELC